MKIIDKSKERLMAGAAVVFFVAVVIIVFALKIADREVTASGGTASAGNLKQEKGTTDNRNTEEETTSNPEDGYQEEPETILQATVTADGTTVITNPDGTTSTLNQGEVLNIVKEVTNENGEKMYQLDNGGYISAEKVSSPVTKPIETSAGNNNPEQNNHSANGQGNNTPSEVPVQPQTPTPTKKPTEASTAAPVQPQTPTPTQKPTEASTVAPVQPQTPAPTQKPTEAPTQAPQPAYEGYRTDLDMQAKQLILNERQNNPQAYKNPTWNEHLYKVAQARAKEIVTNYSHDSAWAGKGYMYSEALTMWQDHDINTASASRAINNWKNSPPHYLIMIGGNQFAVASYQKGDTMYWVCITANEDIYIAENCAATLAADWGAVGSPKYEEKYQKYYNSFVEDYGNRNIW